MEAPESQIPCIECQGEGRIAIGENYVTHDMALDAGESAMEGQSMGIEYVQCSKCGGDGFTLAMQPSPPKEAATTRPSLREKGRIDMSWQCSKCGRWLELGLCNCG